MDEESGCQERIQEVGDRIKKELGMECRVLTEDWRREIAMIKPELPGDEYRAGVKGDSPMGLLYTRYLWLTEMSLLST